MNDELETSFSKVPKFLNYYHHLANRQDVSQLEVNISLSGDVLGLDHMYDAFDQPF